MKRFICTLSISLLLSLPVLALPPDCTWSAGGCEYQAWIDGEFATIFMICDDYVHEYSGAAGSCP